VPRKRQTVVETEVRLPAWLEEAPPEAVQAIYNDLEPKVVETCEAARRGIRDATVKGLKRVRDALAPASSRRGVRHAG
jgi:hypothetical protein